MKIQLLRTIVGFDNRTGEPVHYEVGDIVDVDDEMGQAWCSLPPGAPRAQAIAVKPDNKREKAISRRTRKAETR